MKYKDKYTISKDFEDLFAFKGEKDELNHEARMLMFRFLSELERYNEGGNTLKRNELASRLGVSASYITQLFRGDKLMNFTMLAKIQNAFGITFEIKARKNESLYSAESLKVEALTAFNPEPEGFWVWRNFNKPDYSQADECCNGKLRVKGKRNESAA